MDKLIMLYERLHCKRQSLWLTLDHDKYTDWVLRIFHGVSGTSVVDIQHCDLDYLTSQAYIKLYEWAEEKDLL